MILKLDVVLRNLKGIELEKAFPTVEEINALPKLANGKPDSSKLPKETVKSALLDSLAYYSPADRKEVFRIYSLASKILDCNEAELEVDDSNKEIIIKSLDNATGRRGATPELNRGIFEHWCIAQVFLNCGINE